jgi:predicted ATPase
MASPEDDLVGRAVGQYRIEARVGAGGMGDVYRAHDTKLDRPVALKWLPRGMAGDADRLRRFHAEARAASSLNHPHILVVHDFGDDEGRPFIVTEFVEGESLRARLERGSIPVVQAVEIAAQVAGALAAAHVRGIVHRDVKPENIMLRPDGHVKVVDFGLAKVSASAIDEMAMVTSTQPGVVMGTPRYMSPEQVRGAEVDASSDVWSLGVTLYEMVSGRRPFPDTTPADLVGAILHSEPTLQPLGVVGTIVGKALRKTPLDRYADARDLMVDLVALKRRLESLAPGDDLPQGTTAALSHNFPFQVTRFVGREDDIESLCGALGESRLVTLTGAGGVGKTRLALEVGAALVGRFTDGAWLVNLAPLSDPGLVAATVADALGVREQPGRPVADVLCDHLKSRTLLIVLDNCEHLIDACATLVQRLLASCAGVTVLSTSRETLNVPGESIWRLRSLSVPEAGDGRVASAEGAESVQLFLQRARAVRPGFELTAEHLPSVVQICRRLDGLPLAIELAAARVSAMSTIEIAARLDDRFRLLTGGSRMSVPRQRTLEAAVSWSYELLSPTERILFCRLSVFAGGWTLDAAERVCADERVGLDDIADHLSHLVERSMVAADQGSDGRTRYRMLETFRQFGRDRLMAQVEMTDVRNRHLAWVVALAEPGETGARPHVAAELDNLRAALEWAYETGSYESGLRIMSSPPIGHLSEWTRMLKLLLPFIGRAPIDVQGTLLYSAGGLAFMIGDWQWGVELMRASAEVNARAGNAMRRSMSLTYLGACLWGQGDLDGALDALERGLAVARDAHDIKALTRGLMIRTWLETELDLDRAEALALETELEAVKLENVFDLGHCREVHAYIQSLRGNVEQGARILASALTIFKNIQINCGSHVLETAAAWAVTAGRFELGAEFLGSAQRIREETGDKPRPWEHAVQEMWLPKISASLDPEVFHTALRRGRQRPWADALEFAERALRAAAG